MDSDCGSGLALALGLALGFSTHPICAQRPVSKVLTTKPRSKQLPRAWWAITAGSDQVTRLCPNI